ncbi:helix-turn-helix domain-containing protein [Nitratireductor thuwali]|uniref:HTH-type transcriptional activator Btr n=1 Tax=Nitratireductor thuwali TaxID=2267699 RepID=A0ABY5MGN7_9HYPH|nr:HTH-type transcriptional activator Btr [Nitratireductor thuwali]
MDKSGVQLHYPIMMKRKHRLKSVPNFRLYEPETGERQDFWLHSETLPARSRLHNWEIALHRHEGLFQLFLVQAGEGELLGRGGEAEAFQAPSILYIAPGRAHGFRFSQSADGFVVTGVADRLKPVMAADAAMADYLSASRVLTIETDEGRRAASLVEAIHGELQSRAEAGGQLLLDVLVTEVLLRVARAGAQNALRGEPAGAVGGRGRIAALQDMVAANCRQHLPVSFYAQKLGVSPAHLNRLCRKAAGSSVQELAARHLLRAACRDLVFTPTPVQAIAYSLGFQDPAYFNRFFKRHMGQTPGTFRAMERERLAG